MPYEWHNFNIDYSVTIHITYMYIIVLFSVYENKHSTYHAKNPSISQASINKSDKKDFQVPVMSICKGSSIYLKWDTKSVLYSHSMGVEGWPLDSTKKSWGGIKMDY
jgi:hypothetical protein